MRSRPPRATTALTSRVGTAALERRTDIEEKGPSVVGNDAWPLALAGLSRGAATRPRLSRRRRRLFGASFPPDRRSAPVPCSGRRGGLLLLVEEQLRHGDLDLIE